MAPGCTRRLVLDTLLQRFQPGPEDPWETSDFRCRRMGPDTHLVTCALRQGGRLSRRSTIRSGCGSDWQVVHHQGTVVAQ